MIFGAYTALDVASKLSHYSAPALNQDLYTYDGSYFGANGVFFHSNRPILIETYQVNSNVAAAKGGSFTVLGGTKGNAISVLDNGALYSSGSDAPGDAATWQSAGPIGPGSNGNPGQTGGWMLFSSFIPVSPFSGTANTYGVVWFLNGLGAPLQDIGCMQPGSTARTNCGFAVDLIQRQFGTPAVYQPAMYALDPKGSSIHVVSNTVSTVGQTPRFAEIWMGVQNGNGNTVATVPVPLSTVTTSSVLTSATLNTSIQNTFNLLNYPPMLNCTNFASSTIPSTTNTTVPFTVTPFVDNYSGYSTSATHYVVPLPGMYFAHANVIYNTNFTVGTALAAINVNGTNYFGGAYNASPVANINTGVSVTKLLDLHAGDTVSTVTFCSTASSFGINNYSHFIMAWMCPVSTASTLSWACPDVTGFQFMAGTGPGSLSSIMNTKIANDINFVLNRPYLSVHQTTAQTSLAVNAFKSVTMQSTVGLVHSSVGDNYGGWNVATNKYTAPVNGWYLALGEVNAATTATANSGNSLVAGFSVPTSGGVTAPANDTSGNAGQPDWYQQLLVTNLGTWPTGATGMGVYYLMAGESIAPSAMYQAASGTWGTDVTHGFASHFDLVWLSN